MTPTELDTIASALAAGAAIWPAALTMAAVVVRDRRREARRRQALNMRLHELRRPLQALVLAAKPAPSDAPDPLALALAALRDLDREVNGGAPELCRRPVEARALARAAADRWRAGAARHGRRIALRWHGESAFADADPVRVAQALDNLIANALEHGGGTITIEGGRRGDRIELAVRDNGPRHPPRRRDAHEARRGHGLRIAGELVARQGGALRLRTGARGLLATLELPRAQPRSPR